MDIPGMISDERRRMADLVDSLSPAQLDTPSLCREWSVKEVAGHLLAAVAAPRRRFVSLMVRGGLNPHRANTLLAREMADRPAAELAAGLRAHADTPFRPPIVGYLGPLTDLQIHGQDIRRPLGLPHALRPDRLLMSLDFLVGGRALGFVTRRRIAGLRFEATDLGWAWGAGPAVRGTGEAVLLALTGRDVVVSELDGDGVAVLRRRLTR